MELYESMGFNANPFSNYSAEDEWNILSEIFVKPKYYATIREDLIHGRSKFIFGDRGVGKSALIYSLKSDFDNDNVFSIVVKSYDSVALKNNEKDFLILVIRELIDELLTACDKQKNLLNKLNTADKRCLSLFFVSFASLLQKEEAKRLADGLRNRLLRFGASYAYNKILRPLLNIVLSTTTQTFAVWCNSVQNLPPCDERTYREFVPRLDEIAANESNLNSRDFDLDSIDVETLRKVLDRLAKIIKRLGFRQVVIFFDKIDEYAKLNSKIPDVSMFIHDILVDLSLLSNSEFSLVFALWSKLRKCLQEAGVRYDKTPAIDITWEDAQVREIVDRRINYYSAGDIHSLADIFYDSASSVAKVIELASGSPRYAIMLMEKIYAEQALIDDGAKVFSNTAYRNGANKFISDFDYYTFYAGHKESSLQRVLFLVFKLSSPIFTVKDISKVLKRSDQTAKNRISVMKEYGIIKDFDANSRPQKYEIIDKRLVYAMKHKIRIDE